MPFKSKSQLRLCFSRRPKGWDCNEWLKKTPVRAECLPEHKGGTQSRSGKCRPIRANEHVVGKLQSGPRGGKFFYVDGVKVYVGKNYGHH